MTPGKTKASANPSKGFFVHMLTRDISLEDCILDLVDNSIDGAWAHATAEPNVLIADAALSAYRVQIDFDEESFSIVDNCGGITLDNAADYAFTFGRRPDQEPEGFSVGVYGIGMKRAVFKVGERINIRSSYLVGNTTESFQVPIDVREWLDRDSQPETDSLRVPPSWDFDIEDTEPLPEPGVEIRIDELKPETATRLGDATYARTLRRILGRDYMLPLMRGLQISVNGVEVSGDRIDLRQGDGFAPMRTRYEDEDVAVEIVAGMVAPPPDDTDPDESEKRSNSASGWYILCNGRVVLAADTSPLTGWGVDLPQWHRQYSGFVGLALFSAEKATNLPMTTTKRSVDTSAAVYRRALTRMFEPTRAWITYTNTRKADLDNAKAKEGQASSTGLVEVEQRPTFEVPSLAVPATRARVGNINYAMPLKRIRALAKGLGDSTLTYRDVGIKSFEHAYDELVGDEE